MIDHMGGRSRESGAGGRRAGVEGTWARRPGPVLWAVALSLTLALAAGAGAAASAARGPAEGSATSASSLPTLRPVPATATLNRPGPQAGSTGGVEGTRPPGFVGAETCGECHAGRYRDWAGSTHGRAGGPPGPETVIAPFDGTPIRFSDATVVPAVDSAGTYTFTVQRQDRGPVTHSVDGVIGQGHMVGGGTQGFVTRHLDGTVRFLPFDYSRHEAAWFCNTGRAAGFWTAADERARDRPDLGWVRVTSDLRLADCGDWPPVRVLGTDFRFANCQDCHGSQITLTPDPAAGGFRTGVATLRVNCESCHGPGAEHVRIARAGTLAESGDAGLPTLALATEDGSLETCFQCHALKRALKSGYVPGSDFQTHYSLLLPAVGATPYFPDGRIRTFGYQLNHRQSGCYLDGAMTCVDCHDPHGQGYRDVAAEPLPDRFDDGQCTGCHASKGAGLDRHTRHLPDSEGSRCVACHMPYLQQPELGHDVRYARSDHTIPAPRPAFDEAMGVPNACGACHDDVGTERLQSWTSRLWGRPRPHDGVETALLAVGDGPGLVPADRALAMLSTASPNAMAQVAAVDRLLDGTLTPDADVLDPAARAALQELADHPDLDVRAVALAALHVAGGGDPAVRAFLSDRVQALGSLQEPVLRRWIAALRFTANRYRQRGDPVTALEVVRKGLEIVPADAGTLLDMAVLFEAVGDPAAAVDYYQRSLEANPSQPVAWVNLGHRFEAAGDTEAARGAYLRALALYPAEALAHMGLGNLHLRAGQNQDAVAAYGAAVASDPSLTGAWFNMAAAMLALDRPDEAAEALLAVLEYDPGDAEARALLEEARARRR